MNRLRPLLAKGVSDVCHHFNERDCMSIMPSAKEKREWSERRQRQLKHSRKQVKEYGVWHPDEGLVYTSVSRELCNSHINDALTDDVLRDFGKKLRLVEVSYFHPTKMHGED